MGNSLNDVCDRLQEKLGLLDEAVKELKEALINAQESLGMSIAEIERAIEQISRLGAECLMEQVIERSLEYELKKISLEDYKICSEPAERDPYPPYRERLHPRKHWQRKPYWLRTRSNPKKKAIIKPESLNANEVNLLQKRIFNRIKNKKLWVIFQSKKTF